MSLRDIVNAATPGPWRWAGNLSGWMHLCTVDRGRQYVMGFKRLGMHGAQPTFRVDGWMQPASELAVREAEYRDDIARIDHPDAQFIATFDPQIVGRLLDVVDAARHFVDQRGWAPLVGKPGRCIDCHASIDWDVEHGDHCSYDAMRKAIVSLGDTEVPRG